jgi:hypothetical protein
MPPNGTECKIEDEKYKMQQWGAAAPERVARPGATRMGVAGWTFHVTGQSSSSMASNAHALPDGQGVPPVSLGRFPSSPHRIISLLGIAGRFGATAPRDVRHTCESSFSRVIPRESQNPQCRHVGRGFLASGRRFLFDFEERGRNFDSSCSKRMEFRDLPGFEVRTRRAP